MALSSDINTTSSSFNDIKTVLITKGATPSGNITTYPAAINELAGAPIVIPREVSAQGIYQMPTASFTFSLPSNATDIGDYGLYYALQKSAGLTSVDLSSLTKISGSVSIAYAFNHCVNLVSANFHNLTEISAAQTSSGEQPANYAFGYCSNLTDIDLSSLTTLSGSTAMYEMFHQCTALTSVNLSSLTAITGASGLRYAFNACSSLASVDLSSLTTVSGSNAMGNCFRGCISLTSLSLPALNSNSFGSYTNQFNDMLSGVTDCTVHFPSNLQSVIGSWTSVTSGFGGTNTTVLFDLPATT